MFELPPDYRIPIKCPNCGFNFFKTVGELLKRPTFACKKCKRRVYSNHPQILKRLKLERKSVLKLIKAFNWGPFVEPR